MLGLFDGEDFARTTIQPPHPPPILDINKNEVCFLPTPDLHINELEMENNSTSN